MKKYFVFISLSLLCLLLKAQWQPTQEQKAAIRAKLHHNLTFLASDSLEGRESGKNGEIIARDFIALHLKESGLKPFFNSGSYFKSFEFSSDYTYSKSSEIIAGNASFSIENDFSIVSYSMNLSATEECVYVKNGLLIPEKNINDYSGYTDEDLRGKIFMIDIAFPAQYSFVSDSNYYQIIQNTVSTAIDKEASAVILFSGKKNLFHFNKQVIFQNSRSAIPVIYVFDHLNTQLVNKQFTELTLHLENEKNITTGYNVAAFIDNDASTSVVIGAHYDHLGYGSPISRYVGIPAIHPGADDNASGVVMMLELAELVRIYGLKNHNYIFAAFGAEEKGLLGSKAFVDDSLTIASNIIAMINLDMVGRLDTEIRKLNVLCTGTSTKWDSLLTVAYNPEIDLSKNSSGTGGSDHFSFYIKKIPVLFFITGIHKDYHTPGDIAEKINFEGMTDITVLIYNILFHINNTHTIPFSTVENNEGAVSRAPRGVSLGVIPDHAFGGKGMRIDDVTKGKSADRAGIQAGDIIIAIDEFDISDITTYMKALSHYQSGSTAVIKVMRNNNEKSFDVTF